MCDRPSTAEMVHKHASVAAPSYDESTFITRRSRCNAKDFSVLPISLSRHADCPGAGAVGATSPIGDRHLVAGDLQDELLAGFGAHAARVGRCTRDVKSPS